ncbi:MAG: tetratricopeptide repeat protein [Elusimicrobiota bacterium]
MRKAGFLLFVFLAGNLLAQGDWGQLAVEANKFYEEKNYAQAVEKYQQLLEAGVKNAEVYYNLANGYFKDRQLGRARLCYERAYRLAPNDEDVIFNLNYLRSLIKEPPINFWEILYNSIALHYLTYLASGFYFIFFIFFSILIFRRSKISFYGSLFLGSILFLLVIWWGSRFYSQELVKTAIVINVSAEARNGPGEDYSLGFTVPEGRKVVILEERNEWYAIGLRKEGLKGWLLKNQVEKI